MRSEWRAGTSGRYLDKIRKAIEGLESQAPAQQTVEVIRSINGELNTYRASTVLGRQEQLKRTAERLKAVAPLLRPDEPPFGPIGTNPASLRAPKRSSRPVSTAVRRPDEPVTVLGGVGTAVAARLAQLRIETIEDLLRHTPRHHIDFSRPQAIGQVGRMFSDESVTLAGRITELKSIPGKQRNRVEVRITDGTGWARITWFNPFVAKQLAVGDEIVVHGPLDEFRGGLSLTGPEWERRDSATLARSRLIPVYALTQGLGQKQLRRLTRQAIDETRQTLTDPVPSSVLSELELVGLPFAIDQRHYPANRELLADAMRRLAFDDLFFLQLGLIQRKRASDNLRGNSLASGEGGVPELIDRLPFQLTNAQHRAISDVSLDLGGSRVMQRLIQGDVGSGKTVVAAAAALQATRAGFQTAVMAPTEILAGQLRTTLGRLYEDLGNDAPSVELLTGSTKKRDRTALLERLVNGEIDILVGTHAVIQDGVIFDRLGLTIVDEQHRFGVRQRGELPSKGAVGPAHVLTMSATPIPRSLNLVLLGDIDVSVIDEMPP
ncbi:MAG TPA: DEAD/DEAH box helicase, partial [Thermomicrobiales bacterium]|nr:DEAD/DEAH box helicase [Thermomicrobiales bacterium]